jgi:DNA topoisomerase-1
MSDDPAAAARAAGLRYADVSTPGIERRRAGRGWSYRDPSGETIRDADVLDRIKALVIPPAWSDVWINRHPRGHVQATGLDARGRKQYRYHEKWRATRDETKFAGLIEFAEVLPAVRERVDADLALRGLPRDKTFATVVRLLDESLIRIGNIAYARENKSFGLTTLQNNQAEVKGSSVHFAFRGKSGVFHEVDVRDRRVARIVRRMQDLPGQHLFQYLDEAGDPHSIDSDNVNAYLGEASGTEITAKDFRTWAGTVLAARGLRHEGPFETEAACKAAVVAAVDEVAARLGNTRAVCRAAYIHPAILDGCVAGTLCTFSAPRRKVAGLDEDEQWTLAYLIAANADR